MLQRQCRRIKRFVPQWGGAHTSPNSKVLTPERGLGFSLLHHRLSGIVDDRDYLVHKKSPETITIRSNQQFHHHLLHLTQSRSTTTKKRTKIMTATTTDVPPGVDRVAGPLTVQALRGRLFGKEVAIVSCGESHEDAMDLTRKAAICEPAWAWVELAKEANDPRLAVEELRCGQGLDLHKARASTVADKSSYAGPRGKNGKSLQPPSRKKKKSSGGGGGGKKTGGDGAEGPLTVAAAQAWSEPLVKRWIDEAEQEDEEEVDDRFFLFWKERRDESTNEAMKNRKGQVLGDAFLFHGNPYSNKGLRFASRFFAGKNIKPKKGEKPAWEIVTQDGEQAVVIEKESPKNDHEEIPVEAEKTSSAAASSEEDDANTLPKVEDNNLSKDEDDDDSKVGENDSKVGDNDSKDKDNDSKDDDVDNSKNFVYRMFIYDDSDELARLYNNRRLDGEEVPAAEFDDMVISRKEAFRRRDKAELFDDWILRHLERSLLADDGEDDHGEIVPSAEKKKYADYPEVHVVLEAPVRAEEVELAGKDELEIHDRSTRRRKSSADEDADIKKNSKQHDHAGRESSSACNSSTNNDSTTESSMLTSTSACNLCKSTSTSSSTAARTKDDKDCSASSSVMASSCAGRKGLAHRSIRQLDLDSEESSDEEEDPDDGTGAFLTYLERRLDHHFLLRESRRIGMAEEEIGVAENTANLEFEDAIAQAQQRVIAAINIGVSEATRSAVSRSRKNFCERVHCIDSRELGEHPVPKKILVTGDKRVCEPEVLKQLDPNFDWNNAKFGSMHGYAFAENRIPTDDPEEDFLEEIQAPDAPEPVPEASEDEEDEEDDSDSSDAGEDEQAEEDLLEEEAAALPSWEAFFGSAPEILYYSPHVKMCYLPFLTKCIGSVDQMYRFFETLYFGTIPEAKRLLKLGDEESLSATFVRSKIYECAETGQIYRRPDPDAFGLVSTNQAPLHCCLKGKGSNPPRTFISQLANRLVDVQSSPSQEDIETTRSAGESMAFFEEQLKEAKRRVREIEDGHCITAEVRQWYREAVQALLNEDVKAADTGGDYFSAFLRAVHPEIYDDIDHGDSLQLVSASKVPSLRAGCLAAKTAPKKGQSAKKKNGNVPPLFYNLKKVTMPNAKESFDLMHKYWKNLNKNPRHIREQKKLAAEDVAEDVDGISSGTTGEADTRSSGSDQANATAATSTKTGGNQKGKNGTNNGDDSTTRTSSSSSSSCATSSASASTVATPADKAQVQRSSAQGHPPTSLVDKEARCAQIMAKILVDAFQIRLVDAAVLLSVAKTVRSSRNDRVVIILYAGFDHTSACEQFWTEEDANSLGQNGTTTTPAGGSRRVSPTKRAKKKAKTESPGNPPQDRFQDENGDSTRGSLVCRGQFRRLGPRIGKEDFDFGDSRLLKLPDAWRSDLRNLF
ncbi:unnamed protein product [Amoebophrya sp. A25]|nr:unnamed protein product [Amoebophrya sp. A25]|eukprot:GSA25T00013279001.1